LINSFYAKLINSLLLATVLAADIAKLGHDVIFATCNHSQHALRRGEAAVNTVNTVFELGLH